MTTAKHTPPATFDVGPFTYTVTTDEIALHRAQEDSQCALWGHSDHGLHKITLEVRDTKVDAAKTREVLIHEWLHALMSLSGLCQELKDDTEEKVVTRLAPLILDGLRRNPQLVAYLTA